MQLFHNPERVNALETDSLVRKYRVLIKFVVPYNYTEFNVLTTSLDRSLNLLLTYMTSQLLQSITDVRKLIKHQC